MQMIDWLSRIAETAGIDKVLECVGAAAFNASDHLPAECNGDH
jgi:hypothetical protein